MIRALERVYLELQYHERLIWLYIQDATTFNGRMAIQNGPRKAYLHSNKIGRPDLELHVMEVFDAENARLFRTQEDQTPADLVDRRQELIELRNTGEINDFEFPELDEDMWKEFEVNKGKYGFLE